MSSVRKAGFLAVLMLCCSQLFAQEFYQVGFELYKGNAVDLSDIVYCNLVSGGNPGVDNDDLRKLNQDNENISVYADTGTVKDFAIQTRPLVNCDDTIKLRIYKAAAAAYRIVVDMNFFPPASGLKAVLQDLYLNKEQVLKFGDTNLVSFTVDAAPASSGLRFRVVFKRNKVETAPFTLSSVCSGGLVTLPEVSSNEVKGSWSPSVSNTQSGVYTFTPSEGQCATVVTATLEVKQPVVPVFNTIGPFNSGANFVLPAISVNQIKGSWSPAIDNTRTTTYTFTPESGECATTAQLTVSINDLPTNLAEISNRERKINFFPNPVALGEGTAQLQLVRFPAGSYQVSLTSIAGIRKQVMKIKHNGGASTVYPIDLRGGIFSGPCLLSVEGDNKINLQNKLLIK